MNLKSKMKHYGPALVILSLGAFICVAGTVKSQPDSQTSDPQPSQRERMMRSNGTSNALEGRVFINKTQALPKGVLMAFDKESLQTAVGFGDVGPDGSFVIGNLPEGEVILVLRASTESMARSGGMPKDHSRGPQNRDQDVNNNGPKNSDLAINTSFLSAIPAEQRSLVEKALSKYGNPRRDTAVRLMISEGINRGDIHLVVP